MGKQAKANSKHMCLVLVHSPACQSQSVGTLCVPSSKTKYPLMMSSLSKSLLTEPSSHLLLEQ